MQQNGQVTVDYLIDMRDAHNPDFIARLEAFDGPKNYAELAPIDEENWFRVPDLRDYTFQIPNSSP